MIDHPLSRRQLIRGAGAGMAAGLVRPRWTWAAADGDVAALAAVSRTIEVKRKAAKVYGLTGAGGGSGLTFTVGDRFKVRLTNQLTEPTIVHWHGLTPPSAQDGVPDLSQAPIAAGASYDYDFPLTDPGTYWMHSHFNLTQTQRLLAAPLIVRAKDDLARDEQEVVVMLDDFTFTDPEEILAKLQGRPAGSKSADMPGMEGGKGAAPAGANGGSTMASRMGKAAGEMKMEMGKVGGEMKMEMNKAAGAMKMPMGKPGEAKASGAGATMAGMAMDINDIDFDAYLANDRTLDDPEVVRVAPGGAVRLRLINAANSTNFFIDLGALDGELIAVDGHACQPVRGRNFPIAMAQRLDIRLRLPAGGGSYPVLAQREADTIRTGIVLATKDAPIARIAERAKDKAGVVDLTVEQQLRPVAPLASRPADRTQPVELGGDMQAYVWTMDGAVYGKSKPIQVKNGERVELVMNNVTGMAHPMHLHGTVFQVVAINGKRFDGARRDTVLVPPMGSVTIAFDADNPGRWAFHCHNHYHQAAGMMSSVEYA